MKFIDNLLGHDDDEPEAAGEPMQPDETKELLVKHKQTLQAVSRVLSDSQSRVRDAIDDTGAAIERTPIRRKKGFR